MTKIQNLPPNAPKSPNSHILTLGPFGALRGPSGALGGNIVSLKPLPIKSARKNETFELSMGNTKIFLGVWRVVSMCPTLLNYLSSGTHTSKTIMMEIYIAREDNRK